MVKAVIFDFFGVICSDEYWDFIKSADEISGDFLPLSEAVNLGKISWADFVNRLSSKTGKSVPELLAGYESQKLNPQLLAFIEKLHVRYKTGLITNASRETIERLTRDTNISQYMDAIIISSDVGVIKPDLKIYQLALQKLAVESEECVFIDDSMKHITAAQQIGMNTILYRNFGQMKAELARLLSAKADN